MKNQQRLAIKITTKPELKALMQHFNEKGWHWSSGFSADWNEADYEIIKSNGAISYQDGFMYNVPLDEYTVLTFQQFSELSGVKLLEIEVSLATNETCIVSRQGVGFNETLQELSGYAIEQIHIAYKQLQANS